MGRLRGSKRGKVEKESEINLHFPFTKTGNFFLLRLKRVSKDRKNQSESVPLKSATVSGSATNIRLLIFRSTSWIQWPCLLLSPFKVPRKYNWILQRLQEEEGAEADEEDPFASSGLIVFTAD